MIFAGFLPRNVTDLKDLELLNPERKQSLDTAVMRIFVKIKPNKEMFKLINDDSSSIGQHPKQLRKKEIIYLIYPLARDIVKLFL